MASSDREKFQLRSHRPRSHSLAWRSIAVISCFGVLGCQSCMSREPAREEAPRSPAPAPPEPVQPQEETLEGESDNEMRREEPARDQRSVGTPMKAAPERPAPTSAPKASSVARPERKAGARGRAQAPAEAPGAADDELQKGRIEQPEQLMERLDRAVRSGAADCPSAETRKKAVCDLAAQICELVDRDPNVASVVQYCADAKERCSEASRRTRERCER